jgi:predicted metal-binding membrane protein
MVFDRTSPRVFFGVLTLLFAASATLTIAWCASAPEMCQMPTPGGWTRSMVWLRMPGQTWPDAAASFLGMWAVMMAAMMLPSLAPMLWRYRQAVGRMDETHLSVLTVLVGAGYLFVWTAVGMIVFPLGAVLAAFELQLPILAPAVPVAAGIIFVIAGAFQFTTCKARHLACCRQLPAVGRMPPPASDALPQVSPALLPGSHALPGAGHALSPAIHTLAADAGTAWRHGLHLGLHCVYCSAGLTAIFLAVGIMNLYAMIAVTVAITVERLAPSGERIARAIGAVVVGTGLFLIAQAA